MAVPDVTVIRIPYVKAYIDRHGYVRRYFRKRGCKPVLLPGAPGSAEFMAAYQIALGAPAPRCYEQFLRSEVKTPTCEPGSTSPSARSRR